MLDAKYLIHNIRKTIIMLKYIPNPTIPVVAK